MEEAAKAAAANERKRSDLQVLNEMIDRMSNSADNEIKPEIKMVAI